MIYKDIINQVSRDLNLSPDTVNKVYKAFWKYIRDYIQNLPLKDSINEQEFSQLKLNFNIPSLGKLTCTYKKYIGVKEKFNYIKKLRENYEDTKKD